MKASSEPITRLLDQWRAGQAEAREQVLKLVYQRLRELAGREIARRAGSSPLAPTDLIHEAYLKLDGAPSGWESRQHFFAAAAQVMRRVLIDELRAKHAAKRGGGALTLTLNAARDAADSPLDLGRLEDVLEQLHRLDARKCRLAEMHYFAGMDYEAIADVERMSRATVARDLKFARAWLRSELESDL
ncbi:MAG: ECF-type sigma factor [Pseudomonadota bacterium]